MDGIVYQLSVKSYVNGQRGIPKLPIESAFLSYKGLEGDFNIYRTEKKASTLDRAILILPLETINKITSDGWGPVLSGHLGENITSQGIPYEAFSVGTRWQVDQAMIEIAEVCKPCGNLNVLPYIGYIKAVPFIKALIDRRGWYARVIKEGNISREATILQVR